MANITLYYANEPVATMDLATVDQAKRIARTVRKRLGNRFGPHVTLHKCKDRSHLFVGSRTEKAKTAWRRCLSIANTKDLVATAHDEHGNWTTVKGNSGGLLTV